MNDQFQSEASSGGGPLAPSVSIPEHGLICVIARGAYGEVWLARNAVGTLRAVKIVRRDQHATTETFEREFKGLQKFEPVSRTHEGLVDILTLGLMQEGAGFYYVMELADQVQPGPKSVAAEATRITSSESAPKSEPAQVGCYQPRTLRAELKSRGALPADEVIALGLKLTTALAHLHEQGLVHRDVKPSNILFIGGDPKLADAGLVANMDEARSLVGTAGYIAPEGPGTPQADLYALGKVLYEAAFGKDRKEFPCLPSDVASRPDHTLLLELNEVIGKACASDSRQRYADASSMLAELTALESGHSIKRQRNWQRFLEVGRKLALICAALGGLVAIGWLTSRQLVSNNSGQAGALDFLTSTNELAIDEYRKGLLLFHANSDTWKAIQHFDRATRHDPNFAQAWAQQAYAYYWLGGTNGLKGAAAAEKAVSLNPNLALARSVLATAKLGQLNWLEMDQERKMAVSLAPNTRVILLESALNLAVMGKTNEALADLDKAFRANPDSPSDGRPASYAFVYAWCRQYDKALKIFERAPIGNHPFWNDQLARAYLAVGDYTNSMRFAELAALARGEDKDRVKTEFDTLKKVLMDEGQLRYWEVMLEFEEAKKDPNHLMRMAAIHARLNQADEAFRYLRQARQETPHNFEIGIQTNPSYDSLRKDERFQEMIDELWRKR